MRKHGVLTQRYVNTSFKHFLCFHQIHRATATIIEPTGESDNPLRFTSGLVVALDIDATLEHVQDPQNTVKVQVSLTSYVSDITR